MTWMKNLGPPYRRTTAIITLNVVLALALVACSAAPPSGPTTDPGAPPAPTDPAQGTPTDPVAPTSGTGDGALSSDYEATIRVMEYAGTAPFVAVDEFVTDMIAQKYPNVTLEYEYINADVLSQRITTGVASGDPPDIIAYFPGPDFVKLAEAGTLLDLTPLIEGDEELQRISDLWARTVPTDQYTHMGATYGFTVDLGPLSVWSWQDLLESAGLEGPPTTIEELITSAQALREAGVQPMAVGMNTATIWEVDYTYNALLANFDEDGDSKARLGDRGAISYEDPAFMEALVLFKRLYDSGVFNDEVMEQTYDIGAKGDWSSKRVAMFWPSGPWMTETSPDDTAEDINVTSWPSISGENIVVSGADKVFAALAVTDRQKTPEHALLMGEIVKAYLSKETQAEYYAQGLFPTDVSVVAEAGEPTDPWSKVLVKQVEMVANADRVVDYATYTPQIYAVTTQSIQAYLLDRKSADEVIADLVSAQEAAYDCAPTCP